MKRKLLTYFTMTNILSSSLFCFVAVTLGYKLYFSAAVNSTFLEERRYHHSRNISDLELAQLAGLTNETYLNEVLGKILVPRVVGTQGHENVKEFIGDELKSLGYHVEYDEFQAEPPNFNLLKFTNVVARLDPQAPRFLSLACHYDSKYFRNFTFLGAIDSAVPCAMLLHLAKVLTPCIRNANPKISLMMIFFDGEEAFLNWSETDSIYGARNLAQKWSQSEVNTMYGSVTDLERMDMLMLLDLLGTEGTTFYSFFRMTERWHLYLSQIEKKLKVNSLISSLLPLHFVEKSSNNYIEDDHIPFLKRGVPILHVIPSRFPKIWHTKEDNYSALNFTTIHTLNKVLQVFTYSYILSDVASPSCSIYYLN